MNIFPEKPTGAIELRPPYAKITALNTEKPNLEQLECYLNLVMDEITWTIKGIALVTYEKYHSICLILFLCILYNPWKLFIVSQAQPKEGCIFGGQKGAHHWKTNCLGYRCMIFLNGENFLQYKDTNIILSLP